MPQDEYFRPPDLSAEENDEIDRLITLPADELVKMLASPHYGDSVWRAVCEIGQTATPYLVHALEDPAFRKPYLDTPQHPASYETPLLAVLDCLRDVAPAEAAAPLSALFANESDEVKHEMALLLGSIGGDACLPGLALALSDEDDYVQSGALSALCDAAEDNQLTQNFIDKIFELLEPLLWINTETLEDGAGSAMLAIDRERAIRILTAPDGITIGREGLCNVLEALAIAEVVVEEKLLLDLVDQLLPSPSNNPNYWSLSATFMLLTLHHSDESLEAIRRGLKSRKSGVKQAAKEALAVRKGVKDPFQFVIERLEEAGWESLTTPQGRLLAAYILEAEICNGGFMQYFDNSSGDQWPLAREGLDAIKAANDLKNFDRALACFDNSKPSVDCDEREDQVAAIIDNDEDAFSELESLFYDDADGRETLMLNYIVKHADHFR